ncbi:hypothetical protein QYM36_012944 [Artemia franciscana]|uniref:Uncharacterized protein n=1 Tax=Artemia franciscana TaxID=6661 RepID=A0AA88HHI3_ARTSF|nr:hypothetical protein QYM36_012944 [Artemia franciscana]
MKDICLAILVLGSVVSGLPRRQTVQELQELSNILTIYNQDILKHPPVEVLYASYFATENPFDGEPNPSNPPGSGFGLGKITESGQTVFGDLLELLGK